jgi:hypothetical protein
MPHGLAAKVRWHLLVSSARPGGMGCSPDAVDNSTRYIRACEMESARYGWPERSVGSGMVIAPLWRCGAERGVCQR